MEHRTCSGSHASCKSSLERVRLVSFVYAPAGRRQAVVEWSRGAAVQQVAKITSRTFRSAARRQMPKIADAIADSCHALLDRFRQQLADRLQEHGHIDWLLD